MRAGTEPFAASRRFATDTNHIDASGCAHVTDALQRLIDSAAGTGEPVVIAAGTYLTAPLFVPSRSRVVLEEGAVLLGTIDEARIPVVPTRVAGIECPWYPAVLNINGAEDVVVEGSGVIDGQGPYWWEKYWGADGSGGMRADYDARGLRWACDYDCMRPRNVAVMRSRDVRLADFTSRRSGFWNVHVCYSEQVHIDGLRIEGGHGPSTDGIDIDSSNDVLVERCKTTCNDDSICIKSGRDADGVRVGQPCHRVTVRSCRINAGFGVTIGSEVSGGVHDIVLRDLDFCGTSCGFRIKSAEPRRGFIRDVTVENVRMRGVRYPFHLCLNWNAGYSTCTLPAGYAGPVSPVWEKLLDTSHLDAPKTEVSDIAIRHVRCDGAADDGPSRAFDIEGYDDQPIRNLSFEDVELSCTEFGRIEHVEGLRMDGVRVSATGTRTAELDDFDNR